MNAAEGTSLVFAKLGKTLKIRLPDSRVVEQTAEFPPILHLPAVREREIYEKWEPFVPDFGYDASAGQTADDLAGHIALSTRSPTPRVPPPITSSTYAGFFKTWSPIL